MGLFKAILDYYKFRGIRNRNRKIVAQTIDKLMPDLVVMNGPFKGMIYPRKKAAGSSLFPKLLGSYEAELHATIRQTENVDYSEIIIIGCGEGYYAVGMAIKHPNAKIYAYDTNPKAVSYAKEMFTHNGIPSSRYYLGGFCDEEILLSVPIRDKALIICDCEGFEKNIFSEKSAKMWASHDLLVEVHDLFDIEISSYLTRVFNDSHKISSIKSIDDIQKAKTYDYNELAGLDLETKKTLLAEGRGAIMEWFLMESNHS